MGNDDRGEIGITLEGVEYGLRPSFDALRAVEARTGLKLRRLAVAANEVDLSIDELGIVAGEFMRAWGKACPNAQNAAVAQKVDDRVVGNLIIEEGIVPASAKLTVLLVAAISGGLTASGELKAPAVRGTTTGA